EEGLIKEKQTEERRLKKLVNRYADLSDEQAAPILDSITEKRSRIEEIGREVEGLQAEIEETASRAETTTVELADDIESLRRLVLSGGREPTTAVTLKTKDALDGGKGAPEDPITVSGATDGPGFLTELEAAAASVPSLVRDSRIRIKALLSQLVEKIELSPKGVATIHLQTGRLEKVSFLVQSGS
ncbi:MAG TPA: hypothetical protein VM492_18400, partial [Sumerlaeia bacterium]|nr:hypothetical protein [Sumerlaeia bacterium]